MSGKQPSLSGQSGAGGRNSERKGSIVGRSLPFLKLSVTDSLSGCITGGGKAHTRAIHESALVVPVVLTVSVTLLKQR